MPLMAGFHQLRFDQVLDELDFQRVAFHGAGERGVDDGVGHADDVVLRGARERLVLMKAGVGLEGGFDGERNAGLVEGDDAAVTFADVELLMLERIELGELELTVELFVRHVRVISSGGCRAAVIYRGKSLAGRTGSFVHKKSRVHSRGSEDGLKSLGEERLDFSLIRPMARPSPASHDAGLDECEQAGLLASRSFYSAGLTDAEHQWLIGISSLVTAALPHGIWSEDRTRFPILPKPWFEALARVYHHYW